MYLKKVHPHQFPKHLIAYEHLKQHLPGLCKICVLEFKSKLVNQVNIEGN